MQTYPLAYQPIIHIFSSIIQWNSLEIQGFIDRTEITHYKNKKHLLLQNEVCNGIHFINYGFCRVYKKTNGRDTTLHFARQYDFITNTDGLLLNTPSPFSIQTFKETETVFIPYSTMQWATDTIVEGTKLIRLFWEKYIIQEAYKTYSLYTDNPLQRYQQLIAHFPDIDQQVSQKNIASYLNITPEYLSQLKAKAKTTLAL